MVGFSTSDDAAVYRISEEQAMIQTVDFFTPIADDPYIFGQIAAANALSDVYAMGGTPVLALNIVGFPECLDTRILGEILRGGADKVKEAGAVLAGGHSIRSEEPFFGLCVSGMVHPGRILKNCGAQPGDVLILTKQIGSGIINTAVKGGMASKASEEEAVAVMRSLNRKAAETIRGFEVHACTDITGFGFLGHAAEMAEQGDVTLEIDVDKIAYMEDAREYASMGLVPAGAYRNRNHRMNRIDCGNAEESDLDLLFDPQSSGGLLFSVPEKQADAVMEALLKAGLDTKVSLAGKVTPYSGRLIRLRKE